MSLHKLSAGDGYTYLTRQVAAADDTNRGNGTLGAYYEQKGESRGVWMGAGIGSCPSVVPEFSIGGPVSQAQMVALFGEGRHPDADVIEARLISQGVRGRELDRATRLGQKFPVHAGSNEFRDRLAARYRAHNERLNRHLGAPVDADVRATTRTELAQQMFIEQHHRAPADARELSGFLARASRPAPVAVAGFDLTFSPVKSVSTLWAIAPREVSETIAACHADAVADTIGWLEKHACYTRRGAQGIAQVETTGFLAAAFTHRDSRAGDPDLHTHVAVSNKVCTLDGQWLALDGRTLFKNKVAASERYNTRLEALLTDRVGVRFADRADTVAGKRAVREIVGVDGDLPRVWSARRADIETELAALRTQFRADHGRPPTTVEAQKLAQQATLDTRAGKHAPRSLAQQRALWRAEAADVLGGEAQLNAYLQRALAPKHDVAGRTIDVAAAARAVLARVQSERATWQCNHIRAEAERHARAAGLPLREVDRFVDHVVDRVLSPALSIALTPQVERDLPVALRRSDATSVYEIAGSARFTSTAILDAERVVLDLAGRRDGRVVGNTAVGVAVLESSANGVELGPDQAAMVRELATSGARVQLALAPAGTGKTVTLRVLADAWSGDGGMVIGLAPSAAAAGVLRDELGAGSNGKAVAVDTLAKLTHAVATGHAVPDWVSRIGPDSLVIIDEAGMAGTLDLAAAVQFVTSRGACVRLVGDDQQLSALGAGGLLRDLQCTHGAVTLNQVRRFTHRDGSVNHGEAAASLALREGDPAALAYYTDHGRVHVGDPSTALAQAYDAWAADHTAGQDALLLAPTRELVTQLNARARVDRLTRDGQHGREVQLADATRASIGDTIITRRNDRRLATSATDWVTNGDRWTIASVHPDGALDVTHTRTRRRTTLPADYVREQVVLGYASTVHGAQGLTADTCHTLASGDETRQLLYVALTRGRHANHLYLDVTTGADPHAVTNPDALRPPTAVEILTRVLDRDDTATSAHSQMRELTHPAELLRKTVAEYIDAISVAAESVLGADNLARLDAAVETMSPGLTDCPAWAALKTQLINIGLDDRNPYIALEHAARSAPFTAAADFAAVLSWRLQPQLKHRHDALPWLPQVPAQLAQHEQWDRYFARRAELLHQHSSGVAADTTTWTTNTAPRWAAPFVNHDRHMLADLAIWRAAHGTPDTDTRPTGPPQHNLAHGLAQQALQRRLDHVTEGRETSTDQWRTFADAIDPALTADPEWPELAQQLTTAHTSGLSRATLRATATVRPLPDEQPASALRWRILDTVGEKSREDYNTTIDRQRHTAPTAGLRPRLAEPWSRQAQPERVDYRAAFGEADNHAASRRR